MLKQTSVHTQLCPSEFFQINSHKWNYWVKESETRIKAPYFLTSYLSVGACVSECE